ncbi:MAG: protein jag [Acidobacteriota bacterium]
MKKSREEILARVDGFLRELLQKAGLDLQFKVDSSDDLINVRLEGEDCGLVLSSSARVLYSINHLLNQVCYRHSQDGLNFVVDCNDYRSTRELELSLLAKKAAEEVKFSGTPFSLQPMPAAERRVIHVTLAEAEGIRTESQGSGKYRRVIILPAQ